jgi:hypothetical protein
VPTEYYEEHTWPSRFADAPDVAGTWSPWFFWVAGAWLVVLALHGLWVYYAWPSLRNYIRRPSPRSSSNARS